MGDIIYRKFTPAGTDYIRQRDIRWLKIAIRNLRAIRDEDHDLGTENCELLARHEADLLKLTGGGAA